MSLEVVFGALVPAGSEIEFPLRGDLGVAQSDFLQKCRNPTNINAKLIEIIIVGHLVTPKYSKSVQVSHQN